LVQTLRFNVQGFRFCSLHILAFKQYFFDFEARLYILASYIDVGILMTIFLTRILKLNENQLPSRM
jgi:hypothetical protein